MISQGLHVKVHKEELELRIIKLVAIILKVLVGVVSSLLTNWQSHAS